MSITNIFHISYWFSPPYPAYHAVRIAWYTIFGVVLLIGLVALILRTTVLDHTLRVVLRRAAGFGITMGLVGLLLFSFRQEGIALFSWRVWPLVWLAGVVVWGGRILVYTVGRVPQIKSENMAREMRERYLPKPKK